SPLYPRPLLKSTDGGRLWRATDSWSGDRPSSEKNQAGFPCGRRVARAQPDGQRGAGRDPRDRALVWASSAPTLAGSYRIHVPGNCRNRSHGWHTRVPQEEGQKHMTDVKSADSERKPAASFPTEETSSHIPAPPLYPPTDLAAWD